MFLFREIDIKLCQNYTKTYISKILYKIRNIEVLQGRTMSTTQWQCSIIVTCHSQYHVTSLLYYHWMEYWTRDTEVQLTHICFVIILTVFFIDFSRQEHQIDVLQVSFNSRDSQVSAYTPFHFSFTVPLIYPLSFFLYSPFKIPPFIFPLQSL